jgi:hypothetical protein
MPNYIVLEGTYVGVETDPIRIDMNSNVTVYYILVQIRVRIQISPDTNSKRIFGCEFLFGYLLNSTQIAYLKFNICIYGFLFKYKFIDSR